MSIRNALYHFRYMAWLSILIQEKEQINKWKPGTASLRKTTMKYLVLSSWQFVRVHGTHATGPWRNFGKWMSGGIPSSSSS